MIPTLLMYAFLAITFIVSKDLLAIIDPYLMVFIRMGICSILFSFSFIGKKSLWLINYSYIKLMIIVGFLNVYTANIFQLIGLEYIDPIHASLWYNTMPFMIAILNFCIFSTRISIRKTIALIIGWLSFVPLLISQKSYNHNYLYGVFFFLLSAFVMSLSTLLFERNKIIKSYSISMTNALSMAIGAIFSLIHYIFFVNSAITTPTISKSGYLLLAIVIITTMLCSGLYIYFVRKYNALLVTFAGFSLPIFSTLFELLLGQKTNITVAMIISLLLMIIALYLFTHEKHNRHS